MRKCFNSKYSFSYFKITGTLTGFMAFFLLFSMAPNFYGGVQQAHSAEILTLTLEQAISIAMEKNRDIEKAREYAHYVEGKYVEERAAALPQLSLNGFAGMTKDYSQGVLYGIGSAAPLQFSRTADVSLSQPLYTWGKVGAAIRAAEAGLKTADDQLRLFQQAAVRDVTTAFCDILLARELYIAARENLEQKKRLLEESRRKYAVGTATDYDVLAAEVAVENALPATIRSENAITAARHRLRFLLAMDGQDVDASGTLDTQFTNPPDYEQALKTAQSKRPELADLRHRIGIYSELVKIANAENKPRLDFKGSAGWHWLDIKESALNGSSNGAAWNAGLYLTFPFFDGLRGSGKTAQARSDLRTRQIDEARLLESIALEIRTSRDAVKEAADIVQALGGTVKQAERLVQMAEKGYEFGVKIRLELDDAQLNLVQARSNLARAQRDYLVARVNLLWAMGVAGE
jgi:outer membrane protein TolC